MKTNQRRILPKTFFRATISDTAPSFQLLCSACSGSQRLSASTRFYGSETCIGLACSSAGSVPASTPENAVGRHAKPLAMAMGNDAQGLGRILADSTHTRLCVGSHSCEFNCELEIRPARFDLWEAITKRLAEQARIVIAIDD